MGIPRLVPASPHPPSSSNAARIHFGLAGRKARRFRASPREAPALRNGNPLYRLRTVVYPGAMPDRTYNDQIHEWTYDAIGNHLTQTITDAIEGTVRNTLYHYAAGPTGTGNSQKLDWVETAGGPKTTHAYNASGDLTQKTGPGGTETFEYAIPDKLPRISVSFSRRCSAHLRCRPLGAGIG
jgi:hypothetical protein